MKRFLSLLASLVLAASAFAADAANDLILTQRKADNSGNIQRNAAPTASGFLAFDGSKLPTSPSDFTYSTPTLSVPDAFVVSSAGSIGLTAGGTAKNITFSPSTTGEIIGQFNTTAPAAVGINGLHLNGKDASNISFTMDGYGQGPFFISRRANGTAASPSATAADDFLFQFSGRGYGTAFTGTRAQMAFRASELWTATANGTYISFLVVPSGTASGITPLQIENHGRLTLSPSNTSLAAWGVTGTGLAVGAATKTDSSSSGTVATAVANSFAVPTFAASSATTYTNAANLYIAGDVANGTNVTLTNSYGLWNVGKTRLDGNTLQTGTTTTKYGATAAATIGVSADTTSGLLTYTAPSSGQHKFVGGVIIATYNEQTGSTYSVAATDYFINANRAGTITLTLGTATNGRIIKVRTIQAQTVVSASSNVVPLAGGSAGTAILAGTAGKWAELMGDGSNWQVIAGN